MNNAVCAMGDPLFVARVHDLEGELRDARRALREEVERLIDELAPRLHEVARALPVLGPVGGLGVPLQKLADNHQQLYLAVRQDTEIELLGHDGTHLTPIVDDQLATWLDEEPALLFERSIEEAAAKRPKPLLAATASARSGRNAILETRRWQTWKPGWRARSRSQNASMCDRSRGFCGTQPKSAAWKETPACSTDCAWPSMSAEERSAEE